MHVKESSRFKLSSNKRKLLTFLPNEDLLPDKVEAEFCPLSLSCSRPLMDDLYPFKREANMSLAQISQTRTLEGVKKKEGDDT